MKKIIESIESVVLGLYDLCAFASEFFNPSEICCEQDDMCMCMPCCCCNCDC